MLCDVKEGRLTRAGIVFSVMQRDRAESHGQSTLISNIFVEFILYKITKSYLNQQRNKNSNTGKSAGTFPTGATTNPAIGY